MKFTAILRWALVAACGMMLACPAAAADAAAKEPKKPAAPSKAAQSKAGVKAGKAAARETAEPVSWSSSLSEGYRHALADRKPLLIVVAAKWCAPCRKLSGELETAAVEAELARWTPVRLDLDAQADDAGELAVVDVPALRIRTADGQHVAGRDGYVAADELVEWLKKNYEAATAAADDVLSDTGEPSAMNVVRLVKQFQQRNPALREAAVRRLLPYPGVARPVVLKAFREGSLAARLAAMELLEHWKAPLAGLDPWHPDTFTPERLASLEKWTQREVGGDMAPPKRLSAEQLSAARRQIERMLHADEAEADAIRQRLAGWGAALLPEVYARLKDAATDQDRRRLLILRYRLAAPDSLVLVWPGGLERLGDSDPRQRRKAAEELAKLAGGEDKALLLELFADPDPLVREISLRGLQHIGGKAAAAALVKLLADPEPNVRAAVLKQLEETPDAAMVPAVVKYLKQEKDPDLIVHGIYFLRATKRNEALQCLMSLLKHPSWQVRAEAAAGIGKFHEDRYGDPADSLQVSAYVALLQLLDDEDAFVVAKAVEGLSNADLAAAVEPLVKVAEKRPELAANVLHVLAEHNNMRQKAIPYLRKFCKHAQPRVRAAAISALSTAAPSDVAAELAATLDDKESEVRIAAASSLLHLLDATRQRANDRIVHVSSGVIEFDGDVVVRPAPSRSLLSSVVQFLGGTIQPARPVPTAKLAKPAKHVEPAKAATTAKPAEPAKAAKPKPSGDQKPAKGAKEAKADGKGKKPAPAKPEEEVSPQDQWLKECYAGRGRPKWTSQMTGPLEKMLRADSAKERIVAARALVPLGKGAVALPVLCATARANPNLTHEAEEVLTWLPWGQRLKVFQDLLATAARGEPRARLIMALGEVPDRRAAGPAWDLLADPKVDAEEARALRHALMTAYFGQRYYSPNDASPADRRELAEAAKPRTSAGSDWQRLVALTLLATAAPDQAAARAAAMAGDPKLSAALRTNAFRIQFLTQPAKESRKLAVAELKGTDAARKKIAIRYLVQGPSELASLPNGIYLYDVINSMNLNVSYGRTSGTPIVPKPPAGVTVEDVRPLVGDADPETAACAGYLLALLGEPEGMEPLLNYWRQHEGRYDEWNKMMYQAIAVLDDPKYVPILRQIYGKLQEYEVSEFYWTIRIMSGPEILKLRKEIRDKLGTSQLGL